MILQAARRFSEPLVCLSENQVHGFLSFARCADNEALVIPENLQPVLDVCCIIAEVAGGFKPCMIHQRGGSDFCDELLFTVGFAAEEGSFF